MPHSVRGRCRAATPMEVGLQVVGVDEQHVVGRARVEVVAARAAGEPVVAGQYVVALRAIDVGDAIDRDVYRFARGIASDVARDSVLADVFRARAARRKGVPTGVGGRGAGVG